MRVEKWQGAGNAYLILEEDDLPWALDARRCGLLCDARLGVGADGVLVLAPIDPAAVDGADARMTIFNPDGSRSEACGNGTRLAARFLAERLDATQVWIDTEAGVLGCTLHLDGTVTAEMARATLEGEQYVPADGTFPYPHRFVGIGNPHVVIPVDDPAAFPLLREGPVLEHHPWLPQRANIEVVRARGRHDADVRVWERGVGETDACGSGACAVAVALVVDGTCASPVDIHLRGGTLRIDVDDDLSVRMSGPAERVLVAELDAALLARLA